MNWSSSIKLAGKKTLCRSKYLTLVPLCFFSAFVVSAQITLPKPISGNSGIVYDKKHAYSLTAPRDWVLDNTSGASQGLCAVFYLPGSSSGFGGGHRGRGWQPDSLAPILDQKRSPSVQIVLATIAAGITSDLDFRDRHDAARPSATTENVLRPRRGFS